MAALAAFACALAASPDAPTAAACLGNRAACHFKLGALEECVADCTAALETLQQLPSRGAEEGVGVTEAEAHQQEQQGVEQQSPPANGNNAQQRAKLHVRRGGALAALGRLEEALADYDAALRLLPGDLSIQRDAAQLGAALCGGDPEVLMSHGATLFACQVSGLGGGCALQAHWALLLLHHACNV